MKRVLLEFFYFLLIFSLLSSTTLMAGNKKISESDLQLSWNIKKAFKNAVFIENKGQADGWGQTSSPILFAVDRVDQVQFTSSGLIYRLHNTVKISEEMRERTEKNGEKEPEATLHFSCVNMEWLGVNSNSFIETKDPQEGYFTYALSDSSGTNIRSIQANGFRTLTYRNLYPGIDAEYIIPEETGGIKYSLHLRAGADIGLIKFRYTGDVSKIKINRHGELEIKTPDGKITEHAPVSYNENGVPLRSSFRLEGNVISFKIDDAYDPSKPLVIDPWVTTNLSSLSTSHQGYNVDLDNSGNLYVYGGGDPNGSNTPAYEVAKYSPTGTLLWTFNGTLTVPSWSSTGSSVSCPGNFLVDHNSGKVYIGQAFNPPGTQVIRLSTLGAYDNFISNANPDFQEIWEMAFDCTNGQIYACGGGTTSNINFGIIDQISGNVSTSNITGDPGFYQDIVSVAMDNSGVMFTTIASGGVPSVDNHIFRINAAFNGSIWTVPTGFMNFQEAMNKPYLPSGTFSVTSNGANVLAVNDDYLYYYDGLNLRAFDKSTGASMGAPVIVAGHTVLFQDGIAVDNCNILYIGSVGEIKVYSFNGSAFTSLGSISLGTGLLGSHVHDIKYNWSTNSLFVCGEDFAGVYDATFSTTCNNLTITATSDCFGNSTATVTTSLTGVMFNYTWLDSLGNIVRSSLSASLQNTVTGLPYGLYTVRVQVNPECGGPSSQATFHITNAGAFSVTPSTTAVTCNGRVDGTATVDIINGTLPFAYSWNTSPSQATATALNLGPGTYECTITDGAGCTASVSVTVIQPAQMLGVASGSATGCSGQIHNVSIQVSGGTRPYNYSWNSGLGNDSVLLVNPVLSTVYSCIVTDAFGCTFSDFVTINIQPDPVAIAGNDLTVCAGSPAMVGDSSQPGITYDWSPGTMLIDSTSSLTAINTNISSLSPVFTAYILTVTSTAGCTSSDQVIVTITPLPTVSFAIPQGQCLDSNAVSFNALGTLITGQQYNWNFGPDATPSSSNLQNPPSVTFSSPGRHGISVSTSAFGCNGNTVVDSIQIYDMPLANFVPNIYAGCTPLRVSFQNFNNLSENSYQWDFSDGMFDSIMNPNHTFTIPGTYTIKLKVESPFGCKRDTTFKDLLLVYPLPVAGFSFDPNATTILEPKFQFLNLSSGAENYLWDFGDGNTSEEFEMYHEYNDTGTYTISLYTESAFGCLDTIQQKLRVEISFSFYVPNAFTPNDDGVNDFFKGYGKYIKTFELNIFNRWGEIIYTTNAYDQPWDGKMNSMVQEGVYIYRMEVMDNLGVAHEYIGHVSLVR